MKILSLVENISKSELKAKHGLSLYIETRSHKILFDLGSDNTLFENAAKRNIDLSEVDIVIISHGHVDHGGALKHFMKVNSIAKIYIQKDAFEPHYSRFMFLKFPIGLDKNLKYNKRIILLEGNYIIDEELSLFILEKPSKQYSPINDVLYDKNGRDTFRHEQNLVISEDKVVLIMGCGHCGVVDIMKKAIKYQPSFCIGGFHLYNPFTRRMVSKNTLNEMALELNKYIGIEFYTCHCTGEKAFKHLSHYMSNIRYLSCGDEIVI